MAFPLRVTVPRPRRFFRVWSLRTGVTMILFTLIFNKATALYGLLAPFTGHPLNALQASMYIYSIPVLALCVYLVPYVRSIPSSPFHTLALAYVYIIDSLINAAFTAAFGVAWFVVLAQHPGENAGAGVPGAGMIDSTSGFTSPEHNVSSVNVAAAPAPGLRLGQEAVAQGVSGEAAVSLVTRGVKDAVFDRGSIMSIFVISSLWLLRFYFCTVVLSYARSVLRSHIVATSSTNYSLYETAGASNAKQDSSRAPNPFDESRPEGTGFPGRLGRLMLTIGPDYWLGQDDNADQERWVRSVGGKFGSGRRDNGSPTGGVPERERRRRAGTGPPAPPAGIVEGAGGS